MARPRSDIAARVLRAARRRFLRDGVDGASLRAIAHDAGTTIGMIYYYHPTKDELFLAVVEEVYVGVLAGLETALASARPVTERLRALFARLAALSGDERDVLRLVVREALASPTRLSRLISRFRRGHIPLLLGLVQDGRSQSLFRGDVTPAALVVAIGALAGPAQVALGVVTALLPAVSGSQAGGAELLEILLHGISPHVVPTRHPRSIR
jgi:TetR/AcrR family transcriptional regulator